MRRFRLSFITFAIIASGGPLRAESSSEITEWPVYQGDNGSTQYSELSYIHAGNVHRLEKAWEYRTGDIDGKATNQSNPIMVNGLLYFATPKLNAVALDAATGEERWVFDSSIHNEGGQLMQGVMRGVVYWEDEKRKRIFHFVKYRVYALDANTGELDESFGEGGYIDLRKDLPIDPNRASIDMTSPGIVYEDLLIVGSRVPEGYKGTPGDIRAYDVVTGEFRWIFHTIPKEGEFGYDTWDWVEGVSYGGANAWSGLSLDEERGLVFAATGSPSYDFYGANRPGSNLFGNCVLALDAKTGERKWHYQTVHHDLWDYDNPSAPILATITKEGVKRDVVVQLTKTGLTFVLDRDTGEPVFPVVELPVPQSEIPGEYTHPTQPFPLLPPPLNRLQVTEADLTDITPEAREEALAHFRKYKTGRLFTPPTEQGTLGMPGTSGGVLWQGGSYDPATNTLFVNSSEMPSVFEMKKKFVPKEGSASSAVDRGRGIYLKNCTSCHGLERQGVPPVYPPLRDLTKSDDELKATLRNGKGFMPSFSNFKDSEVADLIAFLKSDDSEGAAVADDDRMEVRYLVEGYQRFWGEDRYPMIKPPWGTLTAIDLANGEFRWKVPLGEYPELAKKGIRNTGTFTSGGAVATSGGLVFVGGSADEKFRAFEKGSGRILWEYQLPAGGYATPTVYAVDGRQYVVIVAAGGGKGLTKPGDSVIAFALPERVEELDLVRADGDASPGWIELFDGESLEGWVRMNGFHSFRVDDGAIVGKTSKGSPSSFLCTQRSFDHFELELEVRVDPRLNHGVQIRSRAKPVSSGEEPEDRSGRVWGPRVEIRAGGGEGRPSAGFLLGEGMEPGYLSGAEEVSKGHSHFVEKAWNRVRVVAQGPRLRTWVNGELVDDVSDEGVYQTHPSGFIGLGIPGFEGSIPVEAWWRNIRIRPVLPDEEI